MPSNWWPFLMPFVSFSYNQFAHYFMCDALRSIVSWVNHWATAVVSDQMQTETSKKTKKELKPCVCSDAEGTQKLWQSHASHLLSIFSSFYSTPKRNVQGSDPTLKPVIPGVQWFNQSNQTPTSILIISSIITCMWNLTSAYYYYYYHLLLLQTLKYEGTTG